MRESAFQHNLIQRLKQRYFGCIVLKNDSSYIQGIPDLLVLYEDKWAMLEVKRDEREARKSREKYPNQSYWIDELNSMSFASYIYPENELEVLMEIDKIFFYN